ncbi:MAG: 30S ribosomal protein S6 [Desulfuromonadales bacterium]|nr:30S ribosomal protein S6 [Desulfuromonadales bacterium]
MKKMYETIYIVKPDLSEEENKSLSEKVQEVVKNMSGDVIKLEDWGARKLAYPINKLNRGRYMYLRADGDSNLIAELERRLRLNDQVIRYQTVKLEKEPAAVAPVRTVETDEAVEENVDEPKDQETVEEEA